MARNFLKKLFTPVTIMVVPHSSRDRVSLKMPFAGIIALSMLFLVGIWYVAMLAVSSYQYYRMKEDLGYYTSRFTELNATLTTLRTAQRSFNSIFSGGAGNSAEGESAVITGEEIDIETLKAQIRETIENVGEIKDYLSQSRDAYVSTPKGWPVEGRITSGFGYRIHPITKRGDFHNALDISADLGTPVRATADGIVSFSGFSGASGNMVAIEHGFGYKTIYVHNKKNVVRIGQILKRGDIVGYVGSTGSSTGPHVHYEIWKGDKNVNPVPYIRWDNYMAESVSKDAASTVAEAAKPSPGRE